MTTSGTILVKHALLAHKLDMLRDRRCPPELFSRILFEAGLILCSEALRDLPEPQGDNDENWLLRRDIVIGVPVLRAGLVFANSLIEILPFAPIGHVGLFRKKHGEDPVNYLTSIPPASEYSVFLILDPVIATGKTAMKAIEILRNAKVSSDRIRVVSLLAYKGGLEYIVSCKENKPIKIYTAGIDEELDKEGFLVPGIGDAGDRLYSTAAEKD
jgi:uracil phosphoribosyltransferase